LNKEQQHLTSHATGRITPLRLVASGVLSLVTLFILRLPARDPRWLVVLGGVAAAAFVVLIPVMVRGNSWQKMIAGILFFAPCLGLVFAAIGTISAISEPDNSPPSSITACNVVRRGLTDFDRQIIDKHQQLYSMSCIPSSVEMVLKLLDRVPVSYYDLQRQWKEKSDGSFRDFDGKTVAGVTFRQQFTLPRDNQFPLAELFETIHDELQAGHFVIVGLAEGDGWHNWVIYDEDVNGEFLAVSKGATGTVDEYHVKKVISQMQGTDIGTYQVQTQPPTAD